MPIRKLKKLYFLIHGLCYAEMLFGLDAASEPCVRLKAYTDRESACAENWRGRIAQFGPEEGLVIIPVANVPGRPSGDFNAFATKILGDRCFILDCPDGSESSFWETTDPTFRQAILDELQGAFVQQNLTCNKEEFDTNLHCLACMLLLKGQLRKRGYEIDPASLCTEGWGASFDGCVTKYSITLRRMLGLAKATHIEYALTVPDAAFILDVATAKRLPLKNGLQLFFFQKPGQSIALFVLGTHSLADGPVLISLPAVLAGVTIRSKQGTRLWPDPEAYQVPGGPPEYFEPPQQLVNLQGDKLSFPASTGFVYRLAKAPAYIFAPPGLSDEEFCSLLVQAEIEMEP